MSFAEQVQLKNGTGTTINPATEETLSEVQSSVYWMKLLLRLLKPLSIVTGSGSNRLSVDINNILGGTLPTVSTVTTVTTVTTVNTVAATTNQVNMGNVAAFTMQQSLLRNAFVNGIRKNIA